MEKGSYKDRFLVSHGGTKQTLLCCKGVWVKCIDWTLVNGETSSQGEHQLADNVALFPESPHSQPDFHCKNSFRFVPERLFDQNSVGCHHLDRRGPPRQSLVKLP